MLTALDRFEKRYRSDPQAAEEFLANGDSPRDPSLDNDQSERRRTPGRHVRLTDVEGRVVKEILA